jgi:hypothetical protein
VPSLDRKVAAAVEADGPAAERAWAEAARELSERAPAVPLVMRARSYFTSARVGNVQQSAMQGVMLEHAWVRQRRSPPPRARRVASLARSCVAPS